MFQLVAMAASAGGLHALSAVLGGLPRDFPLPIAVVQHLDPGRESMLASILGRRTVLAVKQAVAHEPLLGGTVYVGPPGWHLLVGGGKCVRLAQSEPVHHVRPSADRLFESAARHGGPVIAVILTGTGVDGAAGAAAVRAAGGRVIVQDEATSEFFGMPQAAIDRGAVDDVLALGAIAERLVELTRAELS